MKQRLAKYLPLIPVAIMLAAVSFPTGCANTTTPPSGGPKDTIPPVLRKISPMPGSLKVPVRKSQIEFTFNEYVKVKDLTSIYLSPPQDKAPKYKMKGKTLVVYFESDLDSNTTYTLDITGAVVDNNEGNPFPGYTLVFSTGESIDSMMVTGTIQDCNTQMPVKGATVMLYKDASDSAVFNKRPNASAKTDEWGLFSIRNIQDTVYRIYAVQDVNGNNRYDPDNEKVAFLDSAFRPVRVAYDTLPELLKYDMKDTVACMARKSELELNLFREKPSKQMIVKKERVGDRTAYITFMAPGANIHAMRIKGIPREKLISQFNIVKDSLELWVDDQRKMPDTLKLQIRYDKTDTLGKLVPTNEEVPLALDKKAKAKASKSSYRDIKHDDTTCVFTAKADPELVEQYGFVLEFKYPLIQDGFDKMEFRSVNPRQQEKKGTFKVRQDSTNLRRYTVMPDETLMQGFEYFLKVPYREFRDVNGFWNDSTEVKVKLPSDEKLSSMELQLSGIDGEYIVELLGEKRDKVIRSFVVHEDGPVVFPYLKEGSYCIRFTEDPNRNGIVDTGVLLEKKQPEKVIFYKINDSFLIKVPERTELVQEIDIKALFGR